MRSGALKATAVAFVLAAAACNAIVGFEDEYHYLAGAGVGSARDDAGGADAPIGDATPSPDADSATDAPPPLLPCAKGNPSVVWCDDFDTPRADVNLGWDTKEVLNGTPSLVLDGGVNGTGGLRIVTDPTPGSSIRHKAGLWKKISGVDASTTKLVLSCKVKVDTVGNTSGDTLYYAVLAAIRFNGTNGAYYGVARYNTGNGCPNQDCIDESQQGWAQNDPHSFAGSVALGARGAWHSVEISITRSGSSWVGGASWDGFVDQDRPFSDSAAPFPVEVGIGVFYTDTDDGTRANATVHVDDVVVVRD